MANIAAIRSVGNSLAAFLDQAYRAATFPDNVDRPNCAFVLLTIGALKAADINVANGSAQVLILLYRASMNQHMRNSGRPTQRDMAPPPLSVDLHYLLSFWAASAEIEQLVLAWTLRQLHQTPVLDGSILSREAHWEPDDVIQLIPEEISNEDMFRIWDALEPEHYRLSLSYILRVVRIDPDETLEQRRVIASRLNYAAPLLQP
jgi:hypothetical protein